MPKHPLWFKAKGVWKGTVCTCDDRPPGQRTGSGRDEQMPRPSGATCWLGGPDTPPGLGGGAAKRKPSALAPAGARREAWLQHTCQSTRAWDQDSSRSFGMFWKASQKRGLCRVSQGGRTGDSAGPKKPNVSETVATEQEARLPLGSTTTPYGYKAPMDSGWVGSIPRSEDLGVQMSPGATPPVGRCPARAGFTSRRWLVGTSEQQGVI